MLNKVLYLLLVFVVSGSPFQLQAQKTTPPQISLRFDRITVDDGLPSNWTYSVLQDQYGFLWIATRSGLSRFDGYEHHVYLNEPTDPQSLSDHDIKGLFEDSSGTLWICTNSGELNRYNRASDNFSRFPLNPKEATKECWITEDSNGKLWVYFWYDNRVFLDRVQVFDPVTETFKHVDLAGDEAWGRNAHISFIVVPKSRPGKLWFSISNQGVYEIDIVSQSSKPLFQGSDAVHTFLESGTTPGILWLATGEGLGRLDTHTFEYVEYNLPTAINRITEDKKGNLWLANTSLAGDELYFFEKETTMLFQVVIDVVGASNVSGIPPPEGVFNPYIDREGLLWLSSFGGIYRLNWRTAQIQTNRQIPDLSFDRVFDAKRTFRIYEDKSGVIWTGSPGLFRFERTSKEESLFPIYGTVNLSQDLPLNRWNNEGYFSLLCFDELDREPGLLWICSFDDVQTYDLLTSTFKIYDGSGPTTSIDQTPDGNLWFSSTGSGVKRLDRSTGMWKIYLHDVDDPGSIANNFAWNLMVDRSGALWVATISGLDRYRPETDDFEHFRNEGNHHIGLASNVTNCLLEDSKDRFWIGTSAGLTLFNRDDGSFLSYTPGNSTLESPQIVDIIEDDHGHLWLAHYGGRGITRFDPESGIFKAYGVKDGIRIGGSWDLAKGQGGRILAAGTEGWTTFFPEQLEDDPNTPAVELTGFRIANEPILPGDEKFAGRSSYDLEKLELKHNQNDLSIEYVGLHFAAPDLIRYNFMLEGYDKSWRGETVERVATFTNLPFGEYVFRVKAANGDGIWNEEGASLTISILPPWWRTWWAYTIYGLLFVAGVIAADSIQRRRLIAKEREKTRERELAQAREIEKAYTRLKTTQQQLIQQEKMASLGQLTSGIAHEIKNPLNFVNNFSSLIRDLVDDLRGNPDAQIKDEMEIIDTLKMNAEKIHEHGRRADRIVQSMMQHASGGKGERQKVDVNAFVDEYVSLAMYSMEAETRRVYGKNIPERLNTTDTAGLRGAADSAGLQISRNYDDHAGQIEVVPQEIGQVLVNLVNNALYAMIERRSRMNGEYRPQLTVSTKRTDDVVEIRVADNGVGIPREARDKIFEPFFTSKPTGSGTGLGLSLSYDIVTQGHGGSLGVESEEGQGATFIMKLPAL